jgi:hypothetical protein
LVVKARENGLVLKTWHPPKWKNKISNFCLFYYVYGLG